MGGFDVTTGVTTPEAFARADPGASTRPDYHDAYGIGDQWIVEGELCARQKEKSSQCFLPPDIRSRLVARFQHRCGEAGGNYRDAILELKTELLIARDDELNILLTIALGLASSYLTGVFAGAIKRAVGPALTEARQLASARAVAGAAAGSAPEVSWDTVAKGALAHVTNDRIASWTKSVIEGFKTPAKKAMAHAISDVPSADEKTQSASYLDQLRDQCGIAFDAFASTASAHCDDAELIVMSHGMKPERHQPGMYKAALKAKLDRFKKSDVGKIGTEWSHRPRQEGPNFTHRRVVYVQGPRGDTVLRFHDEGYNEGFVTEQLGKPVPDEFREQAIARSEQLFGPVQTIHRNATPVDVVMAAVGHYADTSHHKPTGPR